MKGATIDDPIYFSDDKDTFNDAAFEMLVGSVIQIKLMYQSTLTLFTDPTMATT